MNEKLKYASIGIACVVPLALALTFGGMATSPANSAGAAPNPTTRTPTTSTTVPSNNAPSVLNNVTLPAGTRLAVRLDQTVTSRTAPGTAFEATISDPIMLDGQTVIPNGSRAVGHVSDAKPSGRLKGVARLSLALDSVEVGGTSYTLRTAAYARTGRNHKRRNWTLIGGGAGTGMLIGGLAGGPVGLAIGAGAGSGAGTIASAVTGKKDIVLPAETRIGFSLKEATQVQLASK